MLAERASDSMVKPAWPLVRAGAVSDMGMIEPAGSEGTEMKGWQPGLALALLAPFAVAADLRPSELFRVASQTIVVMEALDDAGTPIAQGSGVTIAPGVVVSNCHVFSQAAIAAVRYQTQRYAAVLRHGDSERDLCSFSVEGLPAPAAVLGVTSTLAVGDRAYAIGAPQGLELTLSDGLLSGFRGEGPVRLIQTTVPISPGSSGGGLFDSSGRLIGITTMYLDKGQQLNFAVPVEWINELPARHQTAGTFRAQPSAAERKARDALTRLGKALQLFYPDEYAAVLPQLKERIRGFASTLPPEQWERATREAFWELVDSSSGDRWVHVATAEGIEIAYDPRSLRRQDAEVEVWVEFKFPRPQNFASVPGVIKNLSLWTIECDSWYRRLKIGVNYPQSGSPEWSDYTGMPAAREPIIPDSAFENVAEAACEISS